MARPIEFIYDSNDRASFLKLLGNLKRLLGSGVYKIIIKKHRRNRTVDQNKLWWVGYVAPFLAYLQDDCGKSHWNDEMAHELLKEMFLREPAKDPRTGEMLCNPLTGEVLVITRSTTDLDVEEFGKLLDRVGAFFANDCGMTNYGSNRAY